MTKANGNFDFSMSGLTNQKREELMDTGAVPMIPVGTECFEVEGFAGGIHRVVVTAENQRHVTMFWNAMFFLKEKDANKKLFALKGEYGAWQQHQANFGPTIDKIAEQLLAEGYTPDDPYYSWEMDERLAAAGY